MTTIEPEVPEVPVETAPEPEPFTLPEDFATQVQTWDIPVDKLAEAAQMYKAAQTEEGVIDGFIAYGQSLGFGLKELNRLFEDEAPAAPAAPVAPQAPTPDPEALMTRAEVDAEIARIREEQQQFVQSQEQRAQAAKQAQVMDGIGTWFSQAGVEDEQTRKLIAGFGEKHVAPNADPYDMRVVAAALERGKADYEAFLQGEAQRYLKGKAASAANQPTPVGGAPAATTGSDEAPVDYVAARGGAFDLARQRVRDRLRAAGELG